MRSYIDRPIPRRGLSRVEAAIYLGISPSKFDELRKNGRIGPAKVLDGRLIFTVEILDEFIDTLPRRKPGHGRRLDDGCMTALALAMPRRLPPGCIEDRDRHGNIRIYYRAKGRPKVRIQGTPWTPEFMSKYDAAKGVEFPTTERSRSALPGHVAMAMRSLLRGMRRLQAA